MKTKKNIQEKYRKKKFGYDQYWKINYTLTSLSGEVFEFISVIKARSLEFATFVLKEKLKEQNSFKDFKFKNFHMFYKNYLNRHKLPLSIKDWQHIRECSFPNQNDYLFKYCIGTVKQEQENNMEEKIKA
jgi:hypothetical protein